ncbi:MAG TPA: hypothetical protein VKM55_01305 [Candidatus Lokiarchaeia archaeon]|nr:hypothetical protein [Candidatus Lokiarchaeia archaeon]
MLDSNEAFQQFVMANKIAINSFIKQQLPQIGENIAARLQGAFNNSVRPCFHAFYERSGADSELPELLQRRMLEIIKLVVIAIKKRYYAFPDPDVIAVSQDILFDRVLPCAAKNGMLDASIDPAILMFNAGEHLREIAPLFYEIMEKIADIIVNESVDIHAAIQIAAWLAGDVQRRDVAIQLLEAGTIPPELLVTAYFQPSISRAVNLSSSLAKDMHELFLQIAAHDRWIPPAANFLDMDYASLASLLWEDGLDAVPEHIKETLLARDEQKNLLRASEYIVLGKAGKYEGFGGDFDTPPVIVGMPWPGSIIVATNSGKIFRIDYGGPGMRIRGVGAVTCKKLACTRDGQLVAIMQNDRVLNIETTLELGSIPAIKSIPGDSILATAGYQVIYIGKKQDSCIYRGNVNFKQDVPDKIEIGSPVNTMAAIDDERIAVITGPSDDKTWTLQIIAGDGSAEFKEKFTKPALIAACDTHVACLQHDGFMLIIELAKNKNETRLVETRIDPENVTSMCITPREIITTHASTHAVYFHGPRP